jgi:RecA-family ATPase
MQPQMHEVLTTEQVGLPVSAPDIDWVWHGYVGRGAVTLLTSKWKAGKTTLLAGLLHHLATDGEFLDRPCRAAKVLVVSEESR